MVEQVNWAEGFPLTAGPRTLGWAEASPETSEYWEGVSRNELLVKRCSRCQAYLHPRRIACSQCGAMQLEWIRASGRGEVYSFSTVYRTPLPELQASLPYNVGIVRLDEGVHLFTRLFTEDGAELQIGGPVEVDFRVLESGQKLPVFVVQRAPME